MTLKVVRYEQICPVRIARVTEYFGPALPAPEWRQAWVEREEVIMVSAKLTDTHDQGVDHEVLNAVLEPSGLVADQARKRAIRGSTVAQTGFGRAGTADLIR